MTWPGHDANLSCDAAHDQITLLLYGELSDEACHRLEQHLAGCADCRDELEVTRALSSAMAILPVREPSPNLLAQTRLKIDEALEQAPRDSWLAPLRRSLWTDFRLLRTAPLAAATMLFAGVGLGFVGIRVATPSPAPTGSSVEAIPPQRSRYRSQAGSHRSGPCRVQQPHAPGSRRARRRPQHPLPTATRHPRTAQ